MQPFDWQFKDRLSRIVAAYHDHGIRVSLTQHVLEVDIGVVPVGQKVGPVTVKVPREAEFGWIATSAGWSINDLTDQIESGVSIRMTILRDGRDLQRGTIGPAGAPHWVPLRSVSGFGEQPFFWPFPIILHGGDDLAFEVRNDDIDPAPVQLQLIGVKIYNVGPRTRPAPIDPPSRSWEATNGWSRLNELMGHVPDILPFRFCLTIDVPQVQNPGGEQVQEVAEIIQGEGDFYCFSSHVELQEGTDSTEGYRQRAGRPEAWRAKVLLSEETGGIRYSNIPIHVSTMFGSHALPVYWPVPAIWRAGREIRLSVLERYTCFQQTGGQTHHARFVFEGFKVLGSTRDLPIDVFLEPRILESLRIYRELGELGRVEPFFYGFNFDDLAAPQSLSTRQQTITITDGAFAGMYLAGAALDSALGGEQFAGEGFGAASVQFTKNEGKIRYQDRPIEWGSLIGYGREFQRFPKPLMINRNESLTCILAMTARGTAPEQGQDMYVTLSGARILPGSSRFM